MQNNEVEHKIEKVVGGILPGHSDITLTLNTYSHVLPAMQEEAAEKLDALLTPIDISDEIKKIKEQQSFYEIPPSVTEIGRE